jgi:23S rRNA (adenine2503-C2)-methyltransferase
MSVPMQGLTSERLCALVPELSLGEARKVMAAVHRRGAVLEPTPVVEGVRARSWAALKTAVHVPTLSLSTKQESSVDPFAKVLFALDGGRRAVEAVRIPLERKGRFVVCVSSQAGCAQGCTYCATGRLGMQRNLEAWEIVDQVRAIHLDLPPGTRVHGVVFQGMGEPLANLQAVLDAIAVLSEPTGGQVSASNITVSTVGSFPGGISRLAREAPKCRLALSVGAARPEVRQQIMPIERIHPLLGAVMEAAVEHAQVTGLQPLWAVTPLHGVNDSVEDAVALAALFHDFTRRTGGIRPRLSIVPYNPSAPPGIDPYQRTPLDQENAFRNALRDAGVFSHKRYSGGGDVGAACGQLAGSVSPGASSAADADAGDVNWAGRWAPGLRDLGRPTLDTAYSA